MHSPKPWPIEDRRVIGVNREIFKVLNSCAIRVGERSTLCPALAGIDTSINVEMTINQIQDRMVLREDFQKGNSSCRRRSDLSPAMAEIGRPKQAQIDSPNVYRI